MWLKPRTNSTESHGKGKCQGPVPPTSENAGSQCCLSYPSAVVGRQVSPGSGSFSTHHIHPLPLPLARLLEHPLPHPRSVPKLGCHLSCGCSPFPARQRGKGFPGASASQSSQELVPGFLSQPPVLCAPLLDPPSPVSPALLLPKLHGLLAGRTRPPPIRRSP